MRGTGNLTQGGDFDNNTTRFWLALEPADAFALLSQYLLGLLGEEHVQTNEAKAAIRVHKAAGQKSVTGVFLLKASDTHAPSGQTLVSMRREKVSDRVDRRADKTRGRSCIGARSGGRSSAPRSSSSTLSVASEAVVSYGLISSLSLEGIHDRLSLSPAHVCIVWSGVLGRTRIYSPPGGADPGQSSRDCRATRGSAHGAESAYDTARGGPELYRSVQNTSIGASPRQS